MVPPDAGFVDRQHPVGVGEDEPYHLVAAGVGGELQRAAWRSRPLHVLRRVNAPQERGRVEASSCRLSLRSSNSSTPAPADACDAKPLRGEVTTAQAAGVLRETTS